MFQDSMTLYMTSRYHRAYIHLFCTIYGLHPELQLPNISLTEKAYQFTPVRLLLALDAILSFKMRRV